MKIHIKNYEEVYKIVERYDLEGIAFASHDEYEPQVIEIANRAVVSKVDELAEFIKDVFEFWFYPFERVDKSVYRNMAKEIKDVVGHYCE